MRTIKGPAIFLAQFLAPSPPFDRLGTLAPWAAGLGYRGVQVPTFDPAILDLDKAAESQSYCDEVRGLLAGHGLVITELSVHRQGHLTCVHPAYDEVVDIFAPPRLRGAPAARQAWAADQVAKAAVAARRLRVARCVGFPGTLLWPFLYLYPPRPAGLVEEAYAEMGRRWRPLLDRFEENGVDLCFEPHPGEDIHDGASFELFLAAVGGHRRCNILYDPSHLYLQHIDYVGFIDAYRERIRAFHVKDAEFNTNARVGTYGGYQPWLGRAGRFRSPGDGDIDFSAIFSKLAEIDYDGWAVLEWECCLKRPEDGAREGVPFIERHIIEVQARAFDAGMQAGADSGRNRRILGVGAPAAG
jgi:sugar phosphate isomerase/epimerase